MAWSGYERRRKGRLSDDEFERVVEHAAERAAKAVEEQFYQELGKALIRRALQVLGAVFVAALFLYAQVKFGFVFPQVLKP